MTTVDTRLVLMRGATFAFTAIRRDPVTLARISLAGTTVRCHVRARSSDVLLGSAAITILDEGQGEYSGAISNAVTAKWPIGELLANVSYEVGGVVSKTESFAFSVEWSPTQ